jgi:hypothetical protein
MGNLPCMGLVLQFRAIPGPRHPDHTHHRLTTGMHVNVLHRHLLLALATMAIQSFEQGGEGAAELTRMSYSRRPSAV